MIRFLVATWFAFAAAQPFAQITVPKGFSIGDIIVIDPVLCRVMEVDLPEPLPEMCQRYAEQDSGGGFFLITALGVSTPWRAKPRR